MRGMRPEAQAHWHTGTSATVPMLRMPGLENHRKGWEGALVSKRMIPPSRLCDMSSSSASCRQSYTSSGITWSFSSARSVCSSLSVCASKPSMCSLVSMCLHACGLPRACLATAMSSDRGFCSTPFKMQTCFSTHPKNYVHQVKLRAGYDGRWPDGPSL